MGEDGETVDFLDSLKSSLSQDSAISSSTDSVERYVVNSLNLTKTTSLVRVRISKLLTMNFCYKALLSDFTVSLRVYFDFAIISFPSIFTYIFNILLGLVEKNI